MKGLWVLLVLAALAAALQAGWALYFCYAAAAALFAGGLLTRYRIDQIEVRRTCSATKIEPGETVDIELILRAERPGAIPWLLAEDRLTARIPHQLAFRFHSKPAALFQWKGRTGQTERIRYQVEFLRRGYFQFGPVLLETGDWIGMNRRARLVPTDGAVMVYPRVVLAQGFDFAAPRPSSTSTIAGRLYEDPTRISGIRPYLPGDALNRIHWPATARTGSFQSKIWEPAIISGATFLFDFEQAEETTPLEVGRAEFAITTIASLARLLFEQSLPIGFASNAADAAHRPGVLPRKAFPSRAQALASLPSAALPEGSPLLLEAKSRGSQWDDLMDLLARLSPSTGHSFAQLLEAVETKLSRQTVLVPVLTSVSEETAVALGNLRRSGFTVAGLVILWEQNAFPDWAEPPEWAALLLSQGIRFRIVDSEEALQEMLATVSFP